METFIERPQELLKQEFQKRRERNPHFSLRSFAKWLDISPAQLSQMMTGKRTITLNSAAKISERLGLSPVEKKNLISSLLNQHSPIETTREKKTLQLKEDQFRLIADWFHFAILSLTQLKDAQADPRWIAHRLGIGVDTAHQALLRLERMGLVQTKPSFKQIGEPIEVVSAVPSEAIRKYHKQNLSLATEKIDTVSVTHREYQSISIRVDPKLIPAFKRHIDDFLESAAEISARGRGQEIYNLNVQLFPVTILKEPVS